MGEEIWTKLYASTSVPIRQIVRARELTYPARPSPVVATQSRVAHKDIYTCRKLLRVGFRSSHPGFSELKRVFLFFAAV